MAELVQSVNVVVVHENSGVGGGGGCIIDPIGGRPFFKVAFSKRWCVVCRPLMLATRAAIHVDLPQFLISHTAFQECVHTCKGSRGAK